ncbi:MAG: hypothetical protein LBT25_07910 [Candidatus Symbiothrix sp.]|jgi:hypothetical protein|nr:hypothetical protein [Candidatus Symbiothrix sp.]
MKTSNKLLLGLLSAFIIMITIYAIALGNALRGDNPTEGEKIELVH